MMTKTVRNTLHTIGDTTGDFAKAFGSGTAGIARRVGSGTAHLAKRVGPRRGLIGLAVVGVALGGTYILIRYLRARKMEAELAHDEPGASNEPSRSRNRTHARGSDRFASP